MAETVAAIERVERERERQDAKRAGMEFVACDVREVGVAEPRDGGCERTEIAEATRSELRERQRR